MNYQKITKCDTANGDGVRVTLWVSGCSHHCDECHNPQTWNPYDGKPFTHDTYEEICAELEKPWVAGLTLSGGDPLHDQNVKMISTLVCYVKTRFPNKTIWCYTGYTLAELRRMRERNMYVDLILDHIDILVDGRYQKYLRDVSYPWAGSSNQIVWANVDGEWIQSEYDKEYREKLNAKSTTYLQK